MDSPQAAEYPAHNDKLVQPLPFIRELLCKRSTAFLELNNTREQGSKSKRGDKYFEMQRKRADTADDKQQMYYFDMMYAIGLAIEKQTHAFKSEKDNPLVLDTCLAPGGFAKVVLELNPTAQICAMTLSESEGGHSVIIGHGDNDGQIRIRSVDITALGIEYGLQPKEIREGMISETLYTGKQFDLAICDGQLLRQNKSHRDAMFEDTAAWKLKYSELIFAMNRLVNGGTMIVLLHKIEALDNIRLITTISKFSNLQLFKHASYHGPRSSCYLVAKNVQSDSVLAHAALADWKQFWRKCVLGAVNTGTESPVPRLVKAKDIETLLEDFGDEFIQLAEPIWLTQTAAIRRAHWFRELPSVQRSWRSFN